MSRERDRHRSKSEENAPPSGPYREDCPCVKKECKNFGYCEPCREKHKKSKPYCERGTAKKTVKLQP